MTFKTKMIIERIARENGTTPEVVGAEMKNAMRKAMTSPKPEAQAFWKRVAPDGREPDIDRFWSLQRRK